MFLNQRGDKELNHFGNTRETYKFQFTFMSKHHCLNNSVEYKMSKHTGEDLIWFDFDRGFHPNCFSAATLCRDGRWFYVK